MEVDLDLELLRHRLLARNISKTHIRNVLMSRLLTLFQPQNALKACLQGRPLCLPAETLHDLGILEWNLPIAYNSKAASTPKVLKPREAALYSSKGSSNMPRGSKCRAYSQSLSAWLLTTPQKRLAVDAKPRASSRMSGQVSTWLTCWSPSKLKPQVLGSKPWRSLRSGYRLRPFVGNRGSARLSLQWYTCHSRRSAPMLLQVHPSRRIAGIRANHLYSPLKIPYLKPLVAFCAGN